MFLLKIITEIIPCIFVNRFKTFNKNCKFNLSLISFLSYNHYLKFIEVLNFFEIIDNSLLPLYCCIYNKIYNFNFLNNDLLDKTLFNNNKLYSYKNNFNWIYFFLSPYKLIKKCQH
jgi:hypothetical protein